MENLYSFAMEFLYPFAVEFLCPFPVEKSYSFPMEYLYSFPMEFNKQGLLILTRFVILCVEFLYSFPMEILYSFAWNNQLLPLYRNMYQIPGTDCHRIRCWKGTITTNKNNYRE